MLQLMLLHAVMGAGAPPADMKPVSFSSKLQARRAALEWYCIEKKAVRCRGRMPPASSCRQRHDAAAAASQSHRRCLLPAYRMPFSIPSLAYGDGAASSGHVVRAPLCAYPSSATLSPRAALDAHAQEHEGEVPCANHQFTLKMDQVGTWRETYNQARRGAGLAQREQTPLKPPPPAPSFLGAQATTDEERKSIMLQRSAWIAGQEKQV
jgi:hypothetical protein